MNLYRTLLPLTLLLQSNHALSDIYLDATVPQPFLLSPNQNAHIVMLNFEDLDITCHFNGNITLSQIKSQWLRTEIIKPDNRINISAKEEMSLAAAQVHFQIHNKQAEDQQISYECQTNQTLRNNRAVEDQFATYQAKLRELPKISNRLPDNLEFDTAFDVLQTLRALIDDIGSNITSDTPERLSTQHEMLDNELDAITERWNAWEAEFNQNSSSDEENKQEQILRASITLPHDAPPPPPPPPPADLLGASSPIQTSLPKPKLKIENLSAAEIWEKLAEISDILEQPSTSGSLGTDAIQMRLDRYEKRAHTLVNQNLLDEIARLKMLLKPSASSGGNLMADLAARLKQRASRSSTNTLSVSTSPPAEGLPATLKKSQPEPRTRMQSLPPGASSMPPDDLQDGAQAAVTPGDETISDEPVFADGDMSNELLSVLSRRNRGGTIRGPRSSTGHAQLPPGLRRSQTLPSVVATSSAPKRSLPTPPSAKVHSQQSSPTGRGGFGSMRGRGRDTTNQLRGIQRNNTLPRSFKHGPLQNGGSPSIKPPASSPTSLQAPPPPPPSKSSVKQPKKLNLNKTHTVGGSGRGGLFAQINSLRKDH